MRGGAEGDGELENQHHTKPASRSSTIDTVSLAGLGSCPGSLTN